MSSAPTPDHTIPDVNQDFSSVILAPRSMLYVYRRSEIPLPRKASLHRGHTGRKSVPTLVFLPHEKEYAIKACRGDDYVAEFDMSRGRNLLDHRCTRVIYPVGSIICDCCGELVDTQPTSKCGKCGDAICPPLCSVQLRHTLYGRPIKLPHANTILFCCKCLEKMEQDEEAVNDKPAVLADIPLAPSDTSSSSSSSSTMDDEPNESQSQLPPQPPFQPRPQYFGAFSSFSTDPTSPQIVCSPETPRSPLPLHPSKHKDSNKPVTFAPIATPDSERHRSQEKRKDITRDTPAHTDYVIQRVEVATPSFPLTSSGLDIDSVVDGFSRKRKEPPTKEIVTPSTSSQTEKDSDVLLLEAHLDTDDELQTVKNFITTKIQKHTTKKKKTIEEEESEDENEATVPSRVITDMLPVRDVTGLRKRYSPNRIERMYKRLTLIPSGQAYQCILWKGRDNKNKMMVKNKNRRATDVAYDLFTGYIDMDVEMAVTTCKNTSTDGYCVQPKHQKKMLLFT